jgi:ribonuclease T1
MNVARLLAAVFFAVGFANAGAFAQGVQTAPSAPAAPVARPAPVSDVALAQLPREARATLELVRKRGPYPYAKDGSIFGNREGHLPRQKRGYYREYTVKTPGERTRGARRLVVGSGGEVYYTDDHYNSFRRVRE